MPVVDPQSVKPKGGGRAGNRIETNNKVQLNPAKGTARFIIEDIWLYPCDERGKYAKHDHKTDEKCGDSCPVNGMKSKWTLRLKKDPQIVFENRMLCGLGPKSKWQNRVGLLTGTEPGSVECRAVNTDDLIGREVLATYAYNKETGYTDIENVMPTEDDAEPSPAPAPAAAPAQQQHRYTNPPPRDAAPTCDPPREKQALITQRQQHDIDALLVQAYEKGWTPEHVRKNCLKVSGGAAEETSKLTAIEANRFFTGLRKMLFQANERTRAAS